ncbi:hypothetical protein LO763_00530 [Glycomyces sp. A-F 0318]|uniref:hypothetical protein n=1 Tax=Glycomyces amatae TaxID=2881355 RepID=UPI001E2A7A1B|nr:hypothetical protein [Glycomyces amatae]MCD0442110.1 hypothetical protein [Glycomyces amatae]
MGRHTTKLGQQSRAQTRPPLPYPVNDGRVAPALQEARDRRSQRRRSRLAAVSAASMLAVGGAAGVSIATAEEPEAGGGGEIVFSGDCGTLGLMSASSIPDSSEVTVERGSQVRYSNDLGTAAELHVGGEVYDIASGATQVFEMNRSAEVAMVPSCHGLFAEYESAQVLVVDAQSEEDESGTEEPDEHELPAVDEPEDEAEPDSEPQDRGAGEGTAQQGPDAGAADEAAEEDDAAAADAEEGADDAESEVNAFGPPPGADDANPGDEAPAAEDEVVAVDPKAVADGANGLLALVAIICLVGVAAAVARTLLKQRATA